MGLQLHPRSDLLFTGEHNHHVTPLDARVGWEVDDVAIPTDIAHYHTHLTDIFTSIHHQPRSTLIHRKPFFAQWTADLDEAAALARSTIRLPNHSDYDQAQRRSRTPSLDRQDAFCDAATAKKRSFRHYHDSDSDAELYRLGLLYDDPHERGEAFSFNVLEHETPVYQLHVRPSKRGRGGLRRHKRSPEQEETASEDVDMSRESSLELQLRLSCTPLGEDGEIARLMARASEPEPEQEDEVEVEPVFLPVRAYGRPELDDERKEKTTST
ncbi:hypothetical protein B0T19DRAFT_83434 [Cercophora scortea]|uniref:Uncharacterized protein n=1 Tax=Cercophora scortea TaxID=314031 RepID=A0AAE0IV87_9PEZI|nr:hypothetical protein B0T19DRAFT_83434 [Cercophora scortea]